MNGNSYKLIKGEGSYNIFITAYFAYLAIFAIFCYFATLVLLTCFSNNFEVFPFLIVDYE